MNSVKTISQGTVDDVEGFLELAGRMCAQVEQHQPGILSYQCFADSDGQVLWVEEYRDEDAFLAHVQELTTSGFLDELMQRYTIDRMTWLGEVHDERVAGTLEQFGAARLAGVAGFSRG